jgi:trimethylamine--corrinoid protein Co-methyltransferase
MTDYLGGGNIIHDVGYLESGLTGSLAQLVICDEILSWLGHYARPLEVSDETLALDLIDEVGPDGQFLDSDHTLSHFRERWYPSLFDRDNYQGWESAGARTLAERAAQRVESILENHKVEPLPDEIVKSLGDIVRHAVATSAS